MSDFVSAAAPSGGIKFDDYKGSLFIIEPLAAEVGVQTAYGTADPVRANVHVITGPGQSEDHLDTLIFPKVLAGQLKGQIGSKVVGRLGQGVAKPGQSAPWILEPATDDDLTKAQEWLAARKPAVTSAQAPF
jgi:hypothetical protein